jgi:hypothetical protein
MTTSRLTPVCALIVCGVLLSACGIGGSTDPTTSTSTSIGTSASTSTTTTLPPTAAENLFISPSTIAELVSTFESYRHVPAKDVAGANPGSIYYGYVPSSRTYWARAEFQPTNAAPLSVSVSMQDGATDFIFSRPSGGAWKPVVAVGEPFCTELLADPVPKSILAVWQLCQGGGTSPSTPQRCTTTQLSVVVGSISGAAGTDRFPLVFINHGSSSCLLQGFPGVSYEGTSGNQIGTPAVRVGSTDGPTLSVAPGASAAADAIVSEGANGSCAHPIQVLGFRIYPPNQYTSLLAARALSVCPHEPPSALQIYAFGVRATL